jgi:hypothetical protein
LCQNLASTIEFKSAPTDQSHPKNKDASSVMKADVAAKSLRFAGILPSGNVRTKRLTTRMAAIKNSFQAFARKNNSQMILIYSDAT